MCKSSSKRWKVSLDKFKIVEIQSCRSCKVFNWEVVVVEEGCERDWKEEEEITEESVVVIVVFEVVEWTSDSPLTAKTWFDGIFWFSCECCWVDEGVFARFNLEKEAFLN